MKLMFRALVLLLSLDARVRADDQPCARVACSGHGQCFEERGLASCLCEAGFSAVALACMPDADEEAVLRARRDPHAGERVADIAMAEVGRRRSEVGIDLAEHAEPLSHYLMPGEWWCGDFVSWLYRSAGVPFSGGSAGGWLVSNNIAIRAWFEARGSWIDHDSPRWSSFVPRPGDFIRFHTDLGGHAAIVHHVVGDTIYAVEGNVGSQVELETHYHFRTNHLIDGFGVLALPNEPPTVVAPEDVAHRWRRPLSLRGSIADDGPSLAIAWAKVEGPGHVHFTDESDPHTRCTFEAPGRYVLRLSAADGEHVVTDDVVIDAFAELTPIVQARLIELDGADARLGAMIENDPVSLRWTQVSGPTVTFSHPEGADTHVTLPEPGSYVLRLTAHGTELTGSDDVFVEVPEPAFGCSASPSSERSTLLFAALAFVLSRRARARRASSSTARPPCRRP